MLLLVGKILTQYTLCLLRQHQPGGGGTRLNTSPWDAEETDL